MTARTIRILQVSTFDTIGGAERVAWNLSRAYRARGYASWLAVGHKLGDDPDVLLVPNDEAPGRRLRWLGKAVDRNLGIEDFRFPGTWRLMDLVPDPPDIVHCHNLHGGYFDLRALPWLSRHVPVVLTLHDAWLLSGHCGHSLTCERWKTGCGHCPDLTLDPPVIRDATAYNWRRKRGIYGSSTLRVATPSRWLMEKVGDSMLQDGIIDARVIPNGVDLTTFHAGDPREARNELALPLDAKVILFAANTIRRNVWKDFSAAREAVGQIAGRLSGQPLLFIALGDDGPPERVGGALVRFVPYQRDPAIVARYYQAADVYVHASRADTFPNSVIEAMACGTPVVATAVGGIPEQVDDSRTGFLVPAGDAAALADRLLDVLSDDELRRRMGRAAAQVARERFDLERQADAYLQWYVQMLDQGERARS